MRKRTEDHERPDDDAIHSVVLVTCPASAARKISRAILDQRAAACVNIVPDVESLFLWKGKVEEAKECLLLIRRRNRSWMSSSASLEAAPRRGPQIIALPVARGYGRYLGLISESVDDHLDRIVADKQRVVEDIPDIWGGRVSQSGASMPGGPPHYLSLPPW